MTLETQEPEPATARMSPATARDRWRRATTAVAAACWLYAATLFAFWLLTYLAADRWWLVTVAMFSPRWVWSVPLFLLLPAAALLRRRPIWLPLASGLVLLVGPVMGLCVPSQRVLARPAASSRPLRVVTLNADQDDLDPAALGPWIDQVRPDVVALQAFARRDELKVFGRARGPGGWYLREDGELFLASRYPIAATRAYGDAAFSVGGGSVVAYDLQTPAGTVRLFNLHLATPRYGLLAVAEHGWTGADQVSKNIDRRRAQSQQARRWVDEAIGEDARVLVVGDFNTPPTSTIYRENWSNFSNAFSAAGFGFGNTHFTRKTAVRIDHVLAGPGWLLRRAWVGPHVGSAHRALVAELELTGPPPF